MSFLDSIMSAVVNPATIMDIAMGPAGWADLAVRTIGTAIGKELIQAVGQELGLPPSVISMAEDVFSAATGSEGGPDTIADGVSQFAQQVGLSPVQQGQLGQQANRIFSDLLQQATAEARKFANKTESGSQSGSVTSKGGFLRAIAAALGAAADDKMNEMATLAGKISAQANANNDLVSSLGGSDPSGNQSAQLQNNSTQLGSLNAMFQAVSQELSILQNVISTALKTVGDAESTVARKN